MRSLLLLSLIALLISPSTALIASPSAQTVTEVPSLNVVFGSPTVFATHDQFVSDGFAWGPSDGQLGMIPQGNGSYTFYGSGGSAATCNPPAPTKSGEGEFAFTGTLDHLTSADGCTSLFRPGDEPSRWVFDRDYAGAGKVYPFDDGNTTGYLMPFHAEIHWQNPANANGECDVNNGATVPCYYSTLGLAVSTDGGKSFKVVGEILQPSQPISVFAGSGKNMAVGAGSLVVADANGKHLDNPPPAPSAAYFYLFYMDSFPGLPGNCAQGLCMGVARAPYLSVINAALSGDPDQVAKVFQKYSGDSPNAWDQPATSDTPDLSGTAGKYAPLWTDGGGTSDVLYDSAFDVYLAVVGGGSTVGLRIRASKDLIHWSDPIGKPYLEAGRYAWYATLVGETGDPTIGGSAPRIYFSSFPIGKFPDYKESFLESVSVMLSSGG